MKAPLFGIVCLWIIGLTVLPNPTPSQPMFVVETYTTAVDGTPADTQLTVMKVEFWGTGVEPKKYTPIMLFEKSWRPYRLPVPDNAKTGLYLGNNRVLVAEEMVMVEADGN